MLYRGLVDSQCCVCCRRTATCFSYIYTCIYSFSDSVPIKVITVLSSIPPAIQNVLIGYQSYAWLCVHINPKLVFYKKLPHRLVRPFLCVAPQCPSSWAASIHVRVSVSDPRLCDLSKTTLLFLDSSVRSHWWYTVLSQSTLAPPRTSVPPHRKLFSSSLLSDAWSSRFLYVFPDFIVAYGGGLLSHRWIHLKAEVSCISGWAHPTNMTRISTSFSLVFRTPVVPRLPVSKTLPSAFQFYPKYFYCI